MSAVVGVGILALLLVLTGVVAFAVPLSQPVKGKQRESQTTAYVSAAIPAGWYSQDDGTWIYWDGQVWTAKAMENSALPETDALSKK